MPIKDNGLQLASAYAPTAVATNVNGTYLDNVAIQDWGMGNSLERIVWYTRIGLTVTGNATATLQFKLQAAIDSAFSAPIDVLITPVAAILQANFATQATAGTEYKIPLPRGFAYRYWRFAVVIGTATLTAGNFDSWFDISGGMQDNKTYAAGYTV